MMCLNNYTQTNNNMPVPGRLEVDQKDYASALVIETSFLQDVSVADMVSYDSSIDPNYTALTTSAFIRESTTSAFGLYVSVSNRDAANKNTKDSVESKLSESTHEMNERRMFEPTAKKKNRLCVTHSYHDYSNATVPGFVDILGLNKTKHSIELGSFRDHKGHRRGPRGGVTTPFPIKLHLMIERAVDDGYADIISWQSHGRCFILHKPKEFMNKVMPAYFRQTRLTSFQRQLNLYGFRRLTAGRDKCGCYHELFLRGKPFLCQHMMRVRIKGIGVKAASSPETEPDFYHMPPIDRSTSACLNPQSTCVSTRLNLKLSAPSTVSLSNTSLSCQECKSQTAEHTLWHVDDSLLMRTVGDNAIPCETSLLFAAPMASFFASSQKCASLTPSSLAVLTHCGAVSSENDVLADSALLFEGKPFHCVDAPIATPKHSSDAPDTLLSLPEKETILSLEDSFAAPCVSQKEQPNSCVVIKNKEDSTDKVHSTDLASGTSELFSDPLIELILLDSFGVTSGFDVGFPNTVDDDSF